MDKCICIKDGYMDGGSVFAIKGHTYLYETSLQSSFGYNVATEGHLDKCVHSMGTDFFNEYFKIKSHTLKEFLKNGI